jgi:hypothetical protein
MNLVQEFTRSKLTNANFQLFFLPNAIFIFISLGLRLCLNLRVCRIAYFCLSVCMSVHLPDHMSFAVCTSVYLHVGL